MSRLSISDAAAWTGAFLRREWRLLAPVAFAFLALPGLFFQLLAPGAQGAAGDVTALAPWMVWLLPVGLVAVAGGLAIVALALVPGISVGEALRTAAARLPTLIAASLILFVAATLATGVLLTLVSFVGVLMGAGTPALRNLGVLLSVAALLVIGARMLLLAPVVVAGERRPVAALRRAWTLSRGHFRQLLGATAMLSLATLIASFAARQSIGVVAILLGRALGAEPLLATLAGVLIAAIGAALSTAFYVLTAAIYRQLAD